MKKKNYFTGSTFQFYVEPIRKYAFCKFFDFRDLSSFHGLIARVFNKFSDNENNNLNQLIDCDWLFGPKSIHKWPNLRRDAGWKSMGILSDEKDSVLPDFKGCKSLPSIIEDEAQLKGWYAIHELTRYRNCEYEEVKHLERIALTTTSLGLSWRTGMEYCRINGLCIDQYYDLQNEGIKATYVQMKNVPIYSSIPVQIRDKAITK